MTHGHFSEAEENIDEEDAGPNVDEESHRDPDLNVNRETGVKKGMCHIGLSR